MTQPLNKYEIGQRVGEKLLGTCNLIMDVVIDELLEERGIDPMSIPNLELDSDFCAGVDDTALECQCCGWYVEPSELQEGDICSDCFQDSDEEE